MKGAENVAADRTGGVAVARVRDREGEGVEHLAGIRIRDRAVGGDRERLLGYPPSPESLQRLPARSMACRERKCAPDGPGRFAASRDCFFEVRGGPGNGAVDGFTPDDVADDQGQRAGSVLAGRMAVGVARRCRRHFVGEAIGWLVARHQPERSRPHHAAASLGVIHGWITKGPAAGDSQG